MADWVPLHLHPTLLPRHCLPNVVGSDLNSDSGSSSTLSVCGGSLPSPQRGQNSCSLGTETKVHSACRGPHPLTVQLDQRPTSLSVSGVCSRTLTLHLGGRCWCLVCSQKEKKSSATTIYRLNNELMLSIIWLRTYTSETIIEKEAISRNKEWPVCIEAGYCCSEDPEGHCFFDVVFLQVWLFSIWNVG